MDEEIKDEPPLSPEQEARIKSLSDAELKVMDETLFSHTTNTYRKVARVVTGAMLDLKEEIKGVPDIFYGHRVKGLVESGQLVSQGNLNRMRYSEVKRHGPKIETTS